MRDLLELIKNTKIAHIPLGELVAYEQPTKYLVDTKEYDNEYITPVLTAGKSFILGYTNEKEGIYKASKDNPVIIFDDFTTSFHWVDFDFKVKSSAMKMLRPKTTKINFRYIYHAMKLIKLQNTEHGRKWIKEFSVLVIPIPPIEVQNTIVKVLDFFTELTTKLTTELTDRKKQYEYYRDKMFNFGDEVQVKLMSEVTNKISSGKNTSRNEEGKFNVYGSTGVISKTNFPRYFTKQLLIARVGANAGLVQIVKGNYDVSDNALIVECDNTIEVMFLYHLLVSLQLKKLARGGGQPLITATQIKNIEIPLPPLEEQQRIVTILDKFDTLVNDLSSGLPAEIEMRNQQYEY